MSRCHQSLSLQTITQNKYYKLMRLDNLTGYLLLVLPILWVIVILANTVLEMVIFIPLFAICGLIARSAGCIINDMVDAEFDKQVSRTKNRPLASGAVTKLEATYALMFLALLGMIPLFVLSYASIVLCLIAGVMTVIYPFLKRYTSYAQVFLGFVFNLGVIVAYLTVSTKASFNPLLIYIASVLWTIAYDTIYSLQDKDDDTKIGLKSMGIKYEEKIHSILYQLYSSFIVLILLVGVSTNMSTLFYVLLGCAAFGLYSTVDTLQVSDPEDCRKKFKHHVYYGCAILLAFMFGKTYL
ncbi:4-hydroxybenzoate octaprenyltransferase [Rickettsiales endosymbiont of Peranema trichophorum]|uniref:4-hydroxybenzoate octaprenyltransferase n=1 Tax=Rickettsiales endosymbiont of Peranema trichophorum TaxID=2486577 RepID=UPI001A918034|nr:4-hydroxybenzoate octaprenyltransferase [Rickettsiales endosymbiont of Peranema trichophorum]